jgi:type IV secretion system protein VirD4
MLLCRLILILTTLLSGFSAVVIGSVAPRAAAIGLVVICLAVAKKKRRQRLTTLGSARWSDADDLRRAGMIGGSRGLILGRIPDSRVKLPAAVKALFDPSVGSAIACEQFLGLFRKMPEPLVRLSNAVHTALFAPTGGGKGVSFAVPHLLTCRDSCVVVDFKGENARLTAEHRRKAFGHRVVVLDPYHVLGENSDTFNPLDSIDKNSSFAIDDCRDLAGSLVLRTGQEHERHWCDSAEAWISGMLAVVAYYGEPGDRSLQTVRTLLSNPAKMEAVIKLMCGATDVWSGMLSRMGNQLTNYKDKELGSTLTTTNRFMNFLDAIAIAENTKSSSFDPGDLCKGKMTVYLVLPPEHMRAQSPLLRMWIGSMLRAVVRGGLQEKNPVHFVLDEAASLGHMDALDDAVDKYRGYGVRLQLFYQSLGQLKKCWPEGQDQTLLSNVSQVYFGVNDQQTAEYVSARLGEETIVVDSGGSSSGTSRQKSWNESNGRGSTSYSSTYSSNHNSNWQQQARKLLKPEEVAALPANVAITFTPGIPPVWTKLIRYYEEPKLGHVPGRCGRCWSGIVTLTRCIALLLITIAILVCATELAKDQHSPPMYEAPNVSTYSK